jgi:alcohol dehydrogenase class IV
MEAYVCGEPNPLTDMICEEGLRRLAPSVVPGCKQDNPRARSDLSFAAMLGGMAITNAKLGAAHGLASALGGKINAPHSVISSRLAPYVMQENIKAAKSAGRNDLLTRYRTIAKLLTGRDDATHQDGVDWVNDMLIKLDIPKLTEFGLCDTSFDSVSQDALKTVAIKGNPLPLTQERLEYILGQVCSCSHSAKSRDDLEGALPD